MPKSKPAIFQPLFGLDREIIDIVVDKLNSTGAESDELRSLVMRWRASGPNLEEMVHSDWDLLEDLQAACPGVWIPSTGARAHILPTLGAIGHANDTPVRRARLIFAIFTLHPRCDLLGGPCDKCDKWFKQNTRTPDAILQQEMRFTCNCARLQFRSQKRKGMKPTSAGLIGLEKQ